MENEKENKKNKVKKTILEAFYWSALGLCLVWALICGAYQTKRTQEINDRLSNIEETLNNKEETRAYKPDTYDNLRAGSGVYVEIDGVTKLEMSDGLTLSGAYEVLTNGINITDSNVYMNWTYSGTDTFLGFSHTSGATEPDTGLAVGDTGSISDIEIGNSVELFSVAVAGGTDPDTPEAVGIDYSLNKRYDFRKWFGEVDPLTGVVNMTASTSNPQYFYDIGAVSVGGITYDHIAISFTQCTNAINIISGYDFQNQCYLAIGGGDYYNNSSNYYVCIGVNLIVGNSYPTTNKLVLYGVPLVGARMQYESGNPISPTDYTPATGFLCSTYELKETGINWTNYLPSETKYNFPGIGNNYSVYEVLQLDLLNDTYLDFYSVSASATGGNVFDLIGNAFKTLVPILGIQVIPGIPIGLLVVLPITATILIVVIKLVRK